MVTCRGHALRLHDRPALLPPGFPAAAVDCSSAAVAAAVAGAAAAKSPGRAAAGAGDIEACHEAACGAGRMAYADPATGYSVGGGVL